MADQALEILLRARNETAAGFKQVTDSIEKTKTQVLSLAVAYEVATKVFDVVTDALKAQAEQEAAINKLNLALANQGHLVGGTSERLQEYAAALQQTTTFSDEVVVAGMATLASFGMNEEQIKKTTAAAADFAAATGRDLQSAIDLLGKAYAGNTTALSRYGIIVDQSLDKHQKFDAVIAQLEKRFGGSAAAATNTYTGSLQQMHNAMNEAEEGLGKLIGQVVGAEKPFSGLVEVGFALAKLFGVDMVIALGEARAIFAETTASAANLLAALFEQLAKLPIVGKQYREQAEFLRSYATNLNAAAAEMREQSDQAAVAAGNLQKFANGLDTGNRGLIDRKAALRALKADHDEFIAGTRLATNYAESEAKALAKIAEQAKKAAQDETKLILLIAASTKAADKSLEDFFKNQERIASDRAKQMLERIKSGQKALEDTAKEQEEHRERIARGLQDLGASLTTVGDIFVQLGGDADSFFVKLADGFSNIANAAGDFMSAFAKRDLFGMIRAGISGLSVVIGTLKSLFTDSEWEKVNDLRDDFVAAAGGITELDKAAQKAGLTLDRLLDAKNVKDYQAAIDELTAAFDLQGEAERKLNEAIERYGFTIDELGPRLSQQKLDEQFGQLFEDWQLLNAAGIDHLAIIERMGPTINEYVNTAIKAGATIPEAMRPIIDELYKQGKLVHENGEAFTEEEYKGLHFAETLTEGIGKLIKEIERLVNALLGIPDKDVNVNVHVNDPDDILSGGENKPGVQEGGGRRRRRGEDFATGWGKITQWGVPAMLHGTQANPEYVLRGDQLGAIVDAAVGKAVGLAMASTGGGSQMQATVLLDGRSIGEAIIRMNESGRLPIKTGSVRR
jgi:hypothetical protein